MSPLSPVWIPSSPSFAPGLSFRESLLTQTFRGWIMRGLILAAAITTGAFAQSYLGGVRGLVQDPGKATIATAKVTLINQGTNVARSELSNASGEFSFSQVDPGTYMLTAGIARLQESRAKRHYRWHPGIPHHRSQNGGRRRQ